MIERGSFVIIFFIDLMLFNCLVNFKFYKDLR